MPHRELIAKTPQANELIHYTRSGKKWLIRVDKVTDKEVAWSYADGDYSDLLTLNEIDKLVVGWRYDCGSYSREEWRYFWLEQFTPTNISATILNFNRKPKWRI